MSKMFPVYDKALWESLVATINADTIFTAISTYAHVSADSTGAMGAAPSGDTPTLTFVAYESPINRTHLLYTWTAT
jgi:hypothetical protein